MGADIHPFVELRNPGETWQHYECLTPFRDRAYGKFAFLAGIRNYSAVPSQLWWNRGWPKDFSVPGIWWDDFHSATWVMLDELLAFDYDAKLEDRRYMDEFGNGGATCEVGKGKVTTYREFLGESYFQDLKVLEAVQKHLGLVRISYGFDS